MNYNIVPVKDWLLIKIPQDWTYLNDGKLRAVSNDRTIKLTISCYESKVLQNVESEFERISTTYFSTFDSQYRPDSEIIKENKVLLKLYNTGRTLEYHAITYAQPMLTRFTIICFVFVSTRNLEDTDINNFEIITSSLTYKVSDVSK